MHVCLLPQKLQHTVKMKRPDVETLLYMYAVLDAGHHSLVNLLYQCVVVPAGYCELAIPVCCGACRML